MPLDQQELLSTFKYSEGVLIRLRSIRGRQSGTLAGSRAKNGYYYVSFNKVKYLMHRLIWFYHHGYFPATVDHINGDPGDNKIENLRAASRHQNMRNTKMRTNNSSGYRGVSKVGKRWHVCITYGGGTVHLGNYDTPEEAARVYDREALTHHREFAQLNFKESKNA